MCNFQVILRKYIENTYIYKYICKYYTILLVHLSVDNLKLVYEFKGIRCKICSQMVLKN